MKATFRSYLAAIAAITFLAGCSKNNQYECIERSENEVPDHFGPGTHTEEEYVLLHDEHKIYASCDVSRVNNLDPDATCGFRPLRTYKCKLQSDSIKKATLLMIDLKCEDGDGHNVYLYVRKKE